MGTHPIFESDFDCLTDLRKWFSPVWPVQSSKTSQSALLSFQHRLRNSADPLLSMSNRTFTLVIHHTPVWVHRPCPRSGTVTIRSSYTSSQRPLPTGWLQKWERAPSTPLSTPVFSLLCPRKSSASTLRFWLSPFSG